MEARWRGLDYDAVAYQLERALGESYEQKYGFGLTRKSWDELPGEAREKIKDAVKAANERLEKAAPDTVKSHVAPRPWAYEYRPGKIKHRFNVAMSGENVRFAVHAANCYDALLAAAQSGLYQIEDDIAQGVHGDNPEDGVRVMMEEKAGRIRAAIERAKAAP